MAEDSRPNRRPLHPWELPAKGQKKTKYDEPQTQVEDQAKGAKDSKKEGSSASDGE